LSLKGEAGEEEKEWEGREKDGREMEGPTFKGREVKGREGREGKREREGAPVVTVSSGC